jgi:hypothetical protein
MRNMSMRKNHKIRLKSNEIPRFFQAGECISRIDALSQICSHMELAIMHPEALRLIDLFNIVPEELSEAGMPYESLKALERHALFI